MQFIIALQVPNLVPNFIIKIYFTIDLLKSEYGIEQVVIQSRAS
jgi:hypothetical protein